jgi:hypothetical protein
MLSVGMRCRGLAKFILIDEYFTFTFKGYNFSLINILFHIAKRSLPLHRVSNSGGSGSGSGSSSRNGGIIIIINSSSSSINNNRSKNKGAIKHKKIQNKTIYITTIIIIIIDFNSTLIYLRANSTGHGPITE